MERCRDEDKGVECPGLYQPGLNKKERRNPKSWIINGKFDVCT